MFDVYFGDTAIEVVFPSGMGDLTLGAPGLRGPAAYSAGVLAVQGTPSASFNLGPYFPPGEQVFTQDRCRVGCLVPPVFDWIATIWRNNTLVGSATILAGELRGVVELFDETFTVTDPEYVNAVCPLVADPTIENPSITLG